MDLVHELPPAASGLGASGEASAQTENSDDPFCSFWQGDDPRIHAELCELLNEEGIPHKTIRREDHLFNLNSRSGFQIGIPYSRFEKAEAAIKDAYGTEEEQQDATRLLPYGKGYAAGLRGAFPWRPALMGFARANRGLGSDPESAAAPVPEEHAANEKSENSQPDWDPTNWDPGDATVAVWSSGESYPGEIIALSLQENQIHARFDKGEGRYSIFVMHHDEARARKIVREIVEGVPPE